MYTRDKEHKDKARKLLTETSFEDIKKNPNKAFEKYLMKAVNECVVNIQDKDEGDRKVYIQYILDQNYDEIRNVIQFDDDLFMFGGDLELTEEENKIKQRMQKLKSEFDQE
jgi:hypothetical protein